MVIEAIGRRLRLAVIGGGPGSVIGEVHRIAARLDGYYEIVASTLSSDPERSRRTGIAIGVPEDRAYPSAQALIENESKRTDRADVIAVMTPNDSHYEICSLALAAGFHLVCDKPLTTDLTTAVSLARKVKSTGTEFCLTHCYTGYPMVRQARAMVQAGAIGAIRQLHLQYVQGYLASENVPPGWRLDPARIGGSMILIDIGTHAHHLGAYVTGLDLESLCADVGHVVPGRKVDDYASVLLRYSNGARGSMWVTNAASGAEHGLSFRIFGETGGLEWHQEEPNRLVHCKRDGFDETVTRRKDPLVSEAARQGCDTSQETNSIALFLLRKTALRAWLLSKPPYKVPPYGIGKPSKCRQSNVRLSALRLSLRLKNALGWNRISGDRRGRLRKRGH